MEEKKVNDDVVIKALVVAKDGFGKLYNGNLYEDALDLIHRLQDENKRLKDEEEEIKLFNLAIQNGEVDMRIESEMAKSFYNSIIQIFEQNGAKNFFTTTVDIEGKKGRYSFTIEKVGGQTVAEKLAKQTSEIKRLTEEYADLLGRAYQYYMAANRGGFHFYDEELEPKRKDGKTITFGKFKRIDKQKKIEVLPSHEEISDLANELYRKQGEFDLSNPYEVGYVLINKLGYRKIPENTVLLTGTETEERLEDLLIEFDEMSFYPATLMPNAEECAREWKRKLIYVIGQLRKEMAEKFAEMADKRIAQRQGERDGYEAFTIDDKAKYDGDIISLALFEICKKITEGKV